MLSENKPSKKISVIYMTGSNSQSEQNISSPFPTSGLYNKEDNKKTNDQGATSPPLLKIEQLTVAYGANIALRQVNMTLEGGNLVGVIGPNGAGKSTLLKAILGMVAYSGQITIEGQPVSRKRLSLAYVPQKEEVRWDFPVTVEDVVMMGRYRRIGWVRFASKRDRQVVDETLEQVGMTNFRHRQISQLSGGQQQRVFVARALAQEGDIILLDEPLTGVDSTSQEVIMTVLNRLREAGKLIIMATHDLNTAAQECNCCCCINHHLVAIGTPKQIFKADILAQTYGGNILTVNLGDDSNDTAALLIK